MGVCSGMRVLAHVGHILAGSAQSMVVKQFLAVCVCAVVMAAAAWGCAHVSMDTDYAALGLMCDG